MNSIAARLNDRSFFVRCCYFKKAKYRTYVRRTLTVYKKKKPKHVRLGRYVKPEGEKRKNRKQKIFRRAPKRRKVE